MYNEKEFLETKKAFEQDCLEDDLFPIAELNSVYENNNDSSPDDIRSVQQYQNRNRDKQPVFH